MGNSFWDGKRRYIALLALIAGILVALNVPPVIPVIQLAGEKYPEGWQLFGLRLTNTFIGSVIVWILLVLLAIFINRRRPRSSSEVPPGGFYNMFEALFEGLYGFIENVAGGAYFRLIFNIFMTIFLIVLLSNWAELVPSIDSVGFIEPHLAEVYNQETGEVEIEYESGYEIYPSVVGYALSPEAEAEADAQALVNSEAAAEAARLEAEEELARQEFEAEHGGHAEEAAAEEETEASGDEGEAAAEEGEHEEEAADEAYNEVLAAREAEKQSRRDRGCYSGVGPVPWASDEEGDSGEAEAADEGEDTETAAAAAEGDDGEGGDGEHSEGEIPLHPDPWSEEAKQVPWVVLPFWRAPSTDLTMTLSLALIAFVMIQVVGFRALGLSYLTKFFNFKTLFTSPLGGIDMAVGLLELIGDFAKILSFAFRLLGNIFAGSILLFVFSFLFTVIPWPAFILEFFVGIIQALVFGLLTAIFMNLATVSHDHDEEHAEEGAH